MVFVRKEVGAVDGDAERPAQRDPRQICPTGAGRAESAVSVPGYGRIAGTGDDGARVGQVRVQVEVVEAGERLRSGRGVSPAEVLPGGRFHRGVDPLGGIETESRLGRVLGQHEEPAFARRPAATRLRWLQVEPEEG